MIVFLLEAFDATMNFITRGWWERTQGAKTVADEIRK